MIEKKNKEKTVSSRIEQELINELIDEIVKRVREEFRKELNNANIEFCVTGIVDSIADINGRATVKFGYGGKIADIPNLTGSNLVPGDKVKVFYNKTNMEGAYVGVKF